MKKIVSMLLATVMLLSMVGMISVSAISTEDIFAVESLSQYEIHSEVLENDGYIGIPVGIRSYVKDASACTDRTRVMIYVVNTNTANVGNGDDEAVLTRWLNEGDIVVILDYFNNEKSVTPELDWSIQGIRGLIRPGVYIDYIPHHENSYVIPRGYDIAKKLPYWSIDKHSSQGTLEYIVDMWNADFLHTRGYMTITFEEDTLITGVQFTKGQTLTVAEYTASFPEGKLTDISQCIAPNGKLLDMNLYEDIIYPVNPDHEVPVMMYAASGLDRINTWNTPDRPHLTGFLFDGYAAAVYDHNYTPMCQDGNYSYYAGDDTISPSGITGIQWTYGIGFDSVKTNTAAVRMVRYLADRYPETYKFDAEKYGVTGISKSGNVTLLGAAVPEDCAETRYPEGTNGQTRYEAGELEDQVYDHGTIYGAEPQPWLTYEGSDEKISSHCQFVYSNVGGQNSQIREGQAPMYICGTMAAQGSYYDYYPMTMAPLYNYDIPVMDYLCQFVGHDFCTGPDLNTGNDTYAALFECANYWLLDEGVKCEYIMPLDGTNFVSATDNLTVKFNATVPYEEFVSKVTVTNDATGKKVSGVWTASYGGTLYEFTPYGMEGGYTYSITIPATLKGENGKAVKNPSVTKFTVDHSGMIAAKDYSTDKNLSYGKDMFFRYEDLSFNSAQKATLRLRVTNDGAANALDVYAATYDGTAYAVGEKLGSIYVCGVGEYDFDVTDYVGDLSNIENVAFCVRTQRAAGEYENYVADFDGDTVGANTSAHSGMELNALCEISDEVAVSGNSLKLGKYSTAVSQGDYFRYIISSVRLFRVTNSLMNRNPKYYDYGRRFKVSFDVYDTTSRLVTTQAGLVCQYDNDIDIRGDVARFETKAGEWVNCEFEVAYDDVKHYTTLTKRNVLISVEENFGTDAGKYPIYLDNYTVTEIVTDVTVEAASLVADPTSRENLQASDMAYVESGTNGDTVMDTTSGVLVSGQTKSLANNSQKVYVKLPLEDYTSGAYSFSFDTDATSKGIVAVYGVTDLAGSNWNSSTITFENAPANDTTGNGVDLDQVFCGAPIQTFSVNGAGTYTVDLSIFAKVMKQKGADYVTLILTVDGEAETLLKHEHFENDTWSNISPAGGINTTTNKFGKIDGVDHTLGGKQEGSCVYICPAGNKTERVNMNVLGLPATLTEADVGRTIQVTFWAKADKPLSIHLYLQGTRNNHVVRAINAADTWQQITWTFTISADDVARKARTLAISLENNADGLTSAYFDDFIVQEVGLGTVNVTPNVTVVPDQVISMETFDNWTTTDWVDASLRTDANGVVDTYKAINNIYQYGFGRNTTGNKIVEAQDATTGTGKSYAFQTTSSGPRAKFYGMLDSLTEADIGRTFAVNFKIMVDSLQARNTQETVSYGMLSALDRRNAATNGLEGEVVDAQNYQTAFYVGDKATITADQIGKWVDCSFTFTLDANMLPREVTSGSKTYKVGIGMFGIGLTSFETAKEGSPTIYIDNIVVTEAADENVQVVTPYSYKQNFDTLTNTTVKNCAAMVSPTTKYLSVDATVKDWIDDATLSSEDAYSGSNSLKIVTHDYNNGVRFLNCFDLKLGAEYTISFRLKSNKAGALWAGLNATGNGLYHNGAAGTYQAINIAAADVGEWVQYTYTFTVDQTMIDTNRCNFILRMGLMRNSNAVVCDTIDGKEVYNAERSTPAVMYLDDFSVTEIVETASGIVITDDMVTVGSNGATSNMEFTLHAAEKNENPENIRKAYISFDAKEDYIYSRSVRLKMTATAAGKQTLTVYGLKNSQLPENLTYNNAPANQKDESLFEFDLYNRKALGTVQVDGAGTYYVDVSDYVREYADEGMLFVLTGNGGDAIVLPEVSLEADRYEEPRPDLKFTTTALELHDNLAIQFKANAGLFESSSYEDPYVVFNFNGVETTVTEYTVVDDKYVFTFRNIAPDHMGDKVQATLCAKWQGENVTSAPLNFAVTDYCYGMLRNSAVANDPAYAELRTLLVDILNYGAAAQVFTGYKASTPVNAPLTETQASWGSSGALNLVDQTTTRYATIENPTAVWKSLALVLQDSVTMRFKFTVPTLENVTVKITSDSNPEGWVMGKEAIQYEESSGRYYVDFSGLHAGQMRECVYVTIYQGDTAISNTARFSVESYAALYQNADPVRYPGFADLCKAMMRYGDAACEFAN